MSSSFGLSAFLAVVAWQMNLQLSQSTPVAKKSNRRDDKDKMEEMPNLGNPGKMWKQPAFCNIVDAVDMKKKYNHLGVLDEIFNGWKRQQCNGSDPVRGIYYDPKWKKCRNMYACWAGVKNSFSSGPECVRTCEKTHCDGNFGVLDRMYLDQNQTACRPFPVPPIGILEDTVAYYWDPIEKECFPKKVKNNCWNVAYWQSKAECKQNCVKNEQPF